MRRSIRNLVRSFQSVWSNLFGHDVFISYARKESRGLARRVEGVLKRRGFTVFRDYSGLIGGDAYRVKLRNAAARCRLHVLLLGEKAVASHWVNKEIRARWAYARLMRRRKQKAPRPFFPVFDQSLDWTVARPLLRKTQGFHGFPMSRPGREVSEWDVLAIAGEVERTFKGWRARKVWRLTGGIILAALLALVGLAGWLHLSAKWRQQSLAWQGVAESTEAERRFLQAEMAWARAVEADWRTRGALTPRYQAARGRRLLTPTWRFPSPGMSLQWIGSSGGQPLLVMANAKLTKLTFHRRDGRAATIPSGEDSSYRFVQTGQGIVALVGDTLWLVDLDAPEDTRTKALRHGMIMGVWQAGFEPPEIRLKGSEVHMLGKVDDRPTLLCVDVSSWKKIGRVPLDVPETSAAIRIAETDKWLAVGAELNRESVVPSLNLLAWDLEGKLIVVRQMARLPEDVSSDWLTLTRVAPSLDDQQFFVALESRRTEDMAQGLPGTSTPGNDFWVGIDVDPSRPVVALGRQVANLKPLHTWDDSEAVFDDGDGELRLLIWEGPHALHRVARTLMPITKSWALLNPGKGMREPVSVAAFQNQRLQLFHGMEPVLEIADPSWNSLSQSIRLAASDDGSWLALQSRPDHDAQGLATLVWRVGVPAPVERIPPLEEIERELMAPGGQWFPHLSGTALEQPDGTEL